jgi:pentatricopeptide repeat protein
MAYADDMVAMGGRLQDAEEVFTSMVEKQFGWD